MNKPIKRPSYKKALEWIALNDEPDWTAVTDIAEMISVQLIADLFEKEPLKVAHDILRFRTNEHRS